MRPVNRGPRPTDDTKNQLKVFGGYGDAREDLINRLGRYCCYCNTRLTHAPEIDHVKPKSLHRHLETDWNNLLLCCKSCNTSKGTQEIDHLFRPDRDNTGRILSVDHGALVPHPSLGDDERKEVSALLTVFNLNGMPRSIGDSRLDDLNKAQVTAQRHQRSFNDGKLDVSDICNIATQIGFWLAWYQEFANHPDVLNALNHAFPGTALECFAPDGTTVARPNGRC
ncbi:MAG: hypothetical protein EAZ99_00500 [Alphaproteobacteria bacterium]|nr:MAG: hypothetical protein EAZ99_00500 [Alphaproteobacteria bacterium]